MTGTNAGDGEGSDKTPENPPASDENQETSEANQDGNSEQETQSAEGGQPADNKETPVAESPGGSIEESEEPADALPEEAPADGEDSLKVQTGSSINAVKETDVEIKVNQYEKDGTVKEDKSTEDRLLQNEAAAEITFIDGTSADGQKALGGERPVKFILEPTAGWKASPTVKYTIAKGGDVKEDKTDTITATEDGVYTIPTNVSETEVQGETPAKPAAYSGTVTISIIAVQAKSTLKLSAAAEGKVVCLTKDGAPDTEKAITDAAGQNLTYAASTGDVTIAVSGLSKDKKYHTIEVKTGAEGAEESEIPASGSKDVTVDSTTTTYTLFTFNPSELDGFAENDDTEITITLTEGSEARGLTLALDADGKGANAKWKAGNVELEDTDKVEYITINDDGTDFAVDSLDPALNEDTLTTGEGAKERVLVFTVTAQAENKLQGENPVTAVLAQGETVVETVNAEYVPKAGETDAYYKIGLAQFANKFTGEMTLTVKAATEVNPEGAGVHSLTFAGDLTNAVVSIKDGETFKKQTSYLAKAESVTFGVAPKPGYTLKKGTDYNEGGNSDQKVVTVSYNKVYELTKTETAGGGKVKAVVPVTGEELVVTQTGDEGPYAKEFKFEDSDSYTDADWKGDTNVVGTETPVPVADIDTSSLTDDAAVYTIENVVVTVATKLDEVEDSKGGTVTIRSYDVDYKVDTADGSGVTKIGTDRYRISEEASLLKLEITSNVKLSVTSWAGDESGTEFELTPAEGGFTCVIPVSLLKTNERTGEIDDSIVISKEEKNLTFASTTDGENDAEFGAIVEIDDQEVGSDYLESLFYPEGEKLSVTLYAKPGTEFTKVTKMVGEGEEETIELGEDKSSVTFPLTMTDNTTVSVALKSVYDAVVAVDDEPLDYSDMKDDAYVIPSGKGNITVTLIKGEDVADLLYAKVYDGEAIADTTVMKIEGAVATIEKISSEDTGVLRVDLASKQTKKVEASVKISQEKAAAKLTVKNEKNNTVTAATLMADSKVTYTVTAADGGRLDFAADNIGVEVVEKADDAAPADASKARENDAVKISDGYDYGSGIYELTVTAKPAKTGKDAAAVIRLYGIAEREAAKGDANAKDKLCLMADPITVKTTDPSVVGQKPVVREATGSDKTLKVELSTTDKVVKPNSVNKIFYKVDITPLTSGVTLPEGCGTQYFEKTKWGKESQLETIVVDTSTEDDKGNRINGSAKDFALKVELVQTTKQTEGKTGEELLKAVKAEVEAGDAARGGEGAVAELRKISTRDALYETKLKMKPASVTVYTGQSPAKVTQAQFNKTTGFTVVPYVQFVNTKTGVLLGVPSGQVNEDGISGDPAHYQADNSMYIYEAKVDINGNVYICNNLDEGMGDMPWEDMPKDLGLKVTAEYPEGAYAASAIVKITTARGIHDIAFAGGMERQLYYSGSNVTLKLTPVLNGGFKETAPKKKTLTYEMGDADGYTSDSEYYNPDPALAQVKVNPKNGSITVPKKLPLSGGECFTVVAKATGYAGSNEDATVYVEIISKPQNFSDLVIVNEYNQVIAGDKGTLQPDDFYEFDENGDVDYDHCLQVRALKEGTDPEKRMYGEEDFVKGVTYASGAKAALAVDAVYGTLTFLKPNAKTVKLTVTNGDGSKKFAKSMEVNLVGYDEGDLGLLIEGDEANEGGEVQNGNPDIHTVTYNGAMNARFHLDTVVKLNGRWAIAQREDDYGNCYYEDLVDYTNLTVKADGAKIVRKPKNGVSWLDIVMIKAEAKITLTDKTTKKKAEYTIKQDPPADSSAKAPSIKQVGKLTLDDVEDARSGGGKKITFQVTNKYSDPKNNARQYVFLSPDYTKTKGASADPYWYEYERANAYFLGWMDTRIIQIGDDGRFSLDLDWSGFAPYEIYPGSYTLTATVGVYKNGKFAPNAKGVNLKISIPGKAIKNSLTVKGKYTLDASAMAPVALDSGKNIVTNFDWELTNEPGEYDEKTDYTNYAMNKIDAKGDDNHFTKFFEVTKEGGTYKLGLKPDLPLDDKNDEKNSLTYIMSRDGAADREGYVTVTTYNDSNHNGDLDDGEELMTKDMKITVTFKNAKPVAKMVQSSVYENGANTTATVKIYETSKSGTPLKLAGAYVEPDSPKDGSAELPKGTGVEADGESLKLTLKSAEPGKSKNYTVKLKVLMADSAFANMKMENKNYQELAKNYGREIKATIKVVVKGTGTKNKVGIENENAGKNKKNFAITPENFDSKSNSYVNSDVNVRSQIEGASITGAAVPTDYAGADIISVALSENKSYLKFTVKRDALIAENKKTSGIKFKFGKAADVPVNFTFDNGVEAEPVTFKVTLPNPMTFEKAVEAATELETTISAMKADGIYDTWNEEMTDYLDAKADLEYRINAMISDAIPQDAQATVAEFELADVNGTGEQADTVVSYKGTVKVTKPKDYQTEVSDYSKDYTFTAASEPITSIDDVVTAIEGFDNAAEYSQLGNDYKPNMLLDDINEQLAAAGKIVGDNLLISVKTFTCKNATAEKGGKVTFVIEVKDRKPVNRDEGYISAETNEMTLAIAELGTLADAAGAVKEAVKEYNPDTEKGINYNEVISTALGTGEEANKGAVEAALTKAIEDAVNAALKNPDITLKGFDPIAKIAGSDNPAKGEDVKVNVDFKIPTGSTEGWAAFKVVLKQEGMKDVTVNCSGDAKISVTPKSLGTMDITGVDESGETPADLSIATGDKVTLDNVEGAKKLTFKVAFTDSKFLTAADEKVVWELVEKATVGEGEKLDTIPAKPTDKVTVTPSADGKTATINIGADVVYGEGNKLTLYLRAKKELTKLYSSDETPILEANRTKVITIELTKKASAGSGS